MRGLRKLNKQDIEDIALGASLLGTGGGGDPYIGKLMALQVLERGREIVLVDLPEIEDDALILPSAAMGTPTVLVEKLPNGNEVISAFKLLENYLGKKTYATTPIEAGGVNSTIPLALAGILGIPVADGDGMGRAFPELQMVTFHLHGVKATPMSLADEKGNRVLLDAVDNFWAEKIARTITIRFGGTAWIALYPMSGADYKKSAIPNTITLAMEIGRVIREAKKKGANVIDALLDTTKGYLLFKGKIVDVNRRNIGGFARGEAKIEGLDEYHGQRLSIMFQNENLVAIKEGEVIASVPDLLTIIDSETGQPITTEHLRYGYRVIIVGIPCSPKWRTPEALKIVGPRYFGYDFDYVPIEKLAKRR